MIDKTATPQPTPKTDWRPQINETFEAWVSRLAQIKAAKRR